MPGEQQLHQRLPSGGLVSSKHERWLLQACDNVSCGC